MARRKKIRSAKVKAIRHRFAQTVDRCIVVASKAPAGQRMKALGRCVKKSI